MGNPAIDIGQLSHDERLALIEELWESLSDNERNDIPLTAAQQKELDRRLDVLDREGSTGIASEELQKRFNDRSL